MAHPRAADDFKAIRARLEELRRERTQHAAHEMGDDPDDEEVYRFADGRRAVVFRGGRLVRPSDR